MTQVVATWKHGRLYVQFADVEALLMAAPPHGVALTQTPLSAVAIECPARGETLLGFAFRARPLR